MFRFAPHQYSVIRDQLSVSSMNVQITDNRLQITSVTGGSAK